MSLSLPLIQAGVIGLTSIGAMAAVAAKTAYQRRPRETPHVHGSARFISPDELRRSRLLVGAQHPRADGVYIGAWKDLQGHTHYLRDASNGHVLVCGPTRSGKGVSCILPTLLEWRGSTIVNDEKGELFLQSGPWREANCGPVNKWEPGEVSGAGSWNPLAEVRLLTPHEIADVQNIALMMIDIRGHGLDRLDHWQKAAVPLLAGLILHELYEARASEARRAARDARDEVLPWVHPDDIRPPPRPRLACLGEIVARFGDPANVSDDTLFEEMRDNLHLDGEPHLFVVAEGVKQLKRSDRERTSVTSTLITFFTIFSDPIVISNTSESDFRLADLSDGKKPRSIFITTLPNDSVRLRPLVRLFLTMALRALMAPRLVYVDQRPVSPHPHDTLIVADEFPTFGKLEEIEAALPRAAGWGVKFLLGVQDLTQLNGIYGLGHSIIANMHTRCFFPTNDFATAEILSKIIGNTTMQTPHTTIMGKRFGLLSQMSNSIQATSRPLLSADEILAMPAAVKDDFGRIVAPGEMLIFQTGQRPLKTEQLLYFQDEAFMSRVQPAA